MDQNPVHLQKLRYRDGMSAPPVAPPAPAATNPYGIMLYTVVSPTGSELNLQTQEEADWYEDRRDRYQRDNQFPNVSDLQDLDRLLTLEVLVYRWSLWMTQGFDYIATRIDEGQLKNYIKEYSTEIRLLKQNMGIDKVARDREKGESLADYMTNLLDKAKMFGYHRDRQYERAVTLMYELRTQVKTYQRCDEREREDLDLSLESIFEWINDIMLEEWDELDEAFRKNQKIWVKEL